MTYSEKLKDPRWQKKRLEILQRDEFMCQLCQDTESTLVVHHYKYSGEPWEAEDIHLITLCESCHESEHRDIKEYKKLLENTMVGLSADSYRAIGSIIYSLKNYSDVPPDIAIEYLERCFNNRNFYNDGIYGYWKENVKRKDI